MKGGKARRCLGNRLGRGAGSLKARAVFGRDPVLILQQKAYLLQIQAANIAAVVAIDDVGGTAIYMPPDQCGHRRDRRCDRREHR